MKMLFVEDDEIIASGLVYAFETEGYDVVYCKDYHTSIDVLNDSSLSDGLSIALLDLSLPDGNGFDICREVKKRLGIPVIFLTAVDDEANTVKGLDIGADDYIAKPFRIRELIARVKSALRRNNNSNGIHADILKISDIELYTKQAKVFKAGKEIPLTALEYRLLLTLASNKGQTLSRTQILAQLWDSDGNYVNDNTLTVNIKRLREKLADDPHNPCIIQTIRGLGYRVGE